MGDHLGPKTSKQLKKMVSTKTVHTYGTFWEEKMEYLEKYQNKNRTIFLYRVKYTESESDIQK